MKDFKTFLEIIGVCQYFSGWGVMPKVLDSLLDSRRRKVKARARREAGAGLEKVQLRSPENVG